MAQEELCRDMVKRRIVKDMLGSVAGSAWKVLILDQYTTRVLSSALKMTDLVDGNVAVVEFLARTRQPIDMDAVYFIQPVGSMHACKQTFGVSKQIKDPCTVSRLLEDFADGKGLYRNVHVFFSSKLDPLELERIKACAPLMRKLKTLKEFNLEFSVVDARTVVTDHPNAFVKLMGDSTSQAPGFEAAMKELDEIATRLVTLLASMDQVPAIRFRLAQPPDPWEPPGCELRATLAAKLATKVDMRIREMQNNRQLPAYDTCDLLILDRSYDPVAPVIHEWTYEAMVHDLLEDMFNDGKWNFTRLRRLGSGDSDGGEGEDVTLDDRDPLWSHLRHLFIADVMTGLAAKTKEFQKTNKAAKMSTEPRDKKNRMSGSAMQELISALPKFQEEGMLLSLHAQITQQLTDMVQKKGLMGLGELEQDLVLGLKNAKDLQLFLEDPENQEKLTCLDKQRLLMCYLATHPSEMSKEGQQQWMERARLNKIDMGVVTNLDYMRVQVLKPEYVEGRHFRHIFTSSVKSKDAIDRVFSKLGMKSSKKEEHKSAIRVGKGGAGGVSTSGDVAEEQEGYLPHFRFDPLLKQVLEELAAGTLSVCEYPYARLPEEVPATPSPRVPPSPATPVHAPPPRSRFKFMSSSNKTPSSSTKAAAGAAAAGGEPAAGPSSQAEVEANSGRSIFVFIIGGAVRSEMRVVHELSRQLGRSVILASTSVDTPRTFLGHLQTFSAIDD